MKKAFEDEQLLGREPLDCATLLETGGAVLPLTALSEPVPELIDISAISAQSAPWELLVKSARFGKQGSLQFITHCKGTRH